MVDEIEKKKKWRQRQWWWWRNRRQKHKHKELQQCLIEINEVFGISIIKNVFCINVSIWYTEKQTDTMGESFEMLPTLFDACIHGVFKFGWNHKFTFVSTKYKWFAFYFCAHYSLKFAKTFSVSPLSFGMRRNTVVLVQSLEIHFLVTCLRKNQKTDRLFQKYFLFF